MIFNPKFPRFSICWEYGMKMSPRQGVNGEARLTWQIHWNAPATLLSGYFSPRKACMSRYKAYLCPNQVQLKMPKQNVENRSMIAF